MKRVFYIILPVLLLLSSCYDDKGNYEYHAINEIATIDHFEAEYVAMFKSAPLVIEPKITFSQDKANEREYSYEWKAVPVLTEKGEGRIIGTEKNLNYIVALEEGDYKLYFKIKDKKEDILWLKETKLIVSSPVSRGFLLVGDDKEGHAVVDMIAMPAGTDQTIVMRDLLADNELPKIKNGIGVMVTGSGKNPKLWLMSRENSYYFDPRTFETSANSRFQNLLFTSFPMSDATHPIQVVPRSINGVTHGSNRFVMCDNGYLFGTSVSSVEFYGNPFNRMSTSESELFKAAPFIFYMVGNSWGVNAAMLYDTDNNKFVVSAAPSSGSGVMKKIADKAGDAFSWQQPDGTALIYGENTLSDGVTGGSSFAIMQQGDDFLIYKVFVANTPSKKGFYKITSKAQDFANSNLYAFSSLRTLLFYAVGSKLYAYDYNPGLEKCVLIKDFGKEITMIKFDIQSGIDAPTLNSLYVATYSTAEAGTLQKIVVGSDPNTLEVTYDKDAVWTNLCKIKDLDWRNS